LKRTEVFNSEGVAHKTGNYPLFFGEQPSLYDSINRPYQYLYDLMEKLKQLDWSPDDVDLTQTRMDLLRCDDNTRNIMLYNLAYQWHLDSVATSIATLFAPFVTNSEYGHYLMRVAENENNHSDTYSNIVRQCVPDPQLVFDMVYQHNQVLERATTVRKVLSELKEIGAKYTLGLVDEEEAAPYVLKGLVAFYALESVSFMASFSCTYGLAEQEYFVGAARLVQKIHLDEMIHIEGMRAVLQDILLKEDKWKDLLDKNREECTKIVVEVHKQEFSWNKYLLSEGRSLVGLNETLLNEWVRYNGQPVFDNLGLKSPFRRVAKDPLPWVKADWVDLNSQQNANMEADNTNYQVSSVNKDLDVNIELDLEIY
jgi:ribonucleoside-diphosphate reductase beta chain